MKLAEALILRADTHKRLLQLRERLVRNARVQEGDTPAEAPEMLLNEYRRGLGEFTELVQRINRTNSATSISEGDTMTDALARRDALRNERAMLDAVIERASSLTADWRYGRSEIKFLPTVNVGDLQQQADDISRRLRELDVVIQQMNWQVDVVDEKS